MKLSRWMHLAFAAALALPAAAQADGVTHAVREDVRHTEGHVENGVRRTEGHVENGARRVTDDARGERENGYDTSVRGADSAANSAAEPLRHTVNVDETYDQRLETGCTYHATVRGSVTPVAENRQQAPELQRLRPNLRVSATVRCPNSTEAHVQERAVRSTGVTREEFENLLALNGSVQRMQNSGRCMYTPDFAFDNATVRMRTVRYLCPSAHGGAARGGGPTDRPIREEDRYPGRYGNEGYVRQNK